MVNLYALKVINFKMETFFRGSLISKLDNHSKHFYIKYHEQDSVLLLPIKKALYTKGKLELAWKKDQLILKIEKHSKRTKK